MQGSSANLTNGGKVELIKRRLLRDVVEQKYFPTLFLARTMAFSAATRVAHHHLHLQHGAMSLPGLGLAEPEEVSKVETAQHDLVKESEWRFEVAAGRYTNVKVSPSQGQMTTTNDTLDTLRLS